MLSLVLLGVGVIAAAAGSLWAWMMRAYVGPGLAGLVIDDDGWATGEGVKRKKAHPSWFYKLLSTAASEPIGVVLHYTVTRCKSAAAMARRRARRRKAGERAASWHFSIECDGTIWQMISCESGAWHCGKGRLDGHRINKSCIGIELVSWDGKEFTEAQIEALKRLLDAICYTYDIPRERALLYHSDFDPKRRSDPGPTFHNEHREDVLDYVYADDIIYADVA